MKKLLILSILLIIVLLTGCATTEETEKISFSYKENETWESYCSFYCDYCHNKERIESIIITGPTLIVRVNRRVEKDYLLQKISERFSQKELLNSARCISIWQKHTELYIAIKDEKIAEYLKEIL